MRDHTNDRRQAWTKRRLDRCLECNIGKFV